MYCKQVIEPKYVLKLTEEERNWLKSYLQNPVTDLEDESPEDYRKRETFFNALNKA